MTKLSIQETAPAPSLDLPECPPAPGEDHNVVGVLQVRAPGPGEVAQVQDVAELCRRRVRDSPVRVHAVAEASVRDEAVERR